jgi:hypothetical protein
VKVQLHAVFDLSTRWKLVVSFMPHPLYNQGESPLYLLGRRPGGHQSQSGSSVETLRISKNMVMKVLIILILKQSNKTWIEF